MVLTLAVLGDSLSQHTFPSGVSIAQGGSGGWVELVAERLANIPSIGPLLSSGLRGVWLGTLTEGDGTWSFTTAGNAWTAITSSNAWDRLFGLGVYGNGVNRIATATLSSEYRSAVAFEVYYMDYTNGGNWQYRINGGTWTNMGQTLVQDNLLAKFRITSTLAPGSTVEVRCFDGTSDCGCALAGIEWVYSTATIGLVVHNLGINGWKLSTSCTAGSGDRLAFLDAVKLGTGSPRNPTPNAGVLNLNINDVLNANTTTWAADLTTLNTRAAPLGPVGFINPWGCTTATYNNTQQNNYRAQTVTTAAGFATPAKVLDMFDAWKANGWGIFNADQVAAGIALGLLNADGTHPERAGQLDTATRAYWFIRNQILGLGNVPSTYTATAKQAAVHYAGKQAAVQYAAGAPISV